MIYVVVGLRFPTLQVGSFGLPPLKMPRVVCAFSLSKDVILTVFKGRSVLSYSIPLVLRDRLVLNQAESPADHRTSRLHTKPETNERSHVQLEMSVGSLLSVRLQNKKRINCGSQSCCGGLGGCAFAGGDAVVCLGGGIGNALTFRHHASYIQDTYRYSPQYSFYITAV